MRGQGLRVGMVAVALATAFGVRPPGASACSCATIENIRADLAAAGGAFVGTLEKVDLGEPGQDSAFHFRVESAVKGGMGEQVVVYSEVSDGANCALLADRGERLAMFLSRREDNEWQGDSCSLVTPERLLAAARPLPEPDGSGPPALIIGDSLGDHRTVALDGQGRTLAYGTGLGPAAGDVLGIDVCPGSRRVVEVLAPDDVNSDSAVVVRSLDTLAIERVVTGRDVVGAPAFARSVQCRDARGQRIDVAVWLMSSSGREAAMMRLTDAGPGQVWRAQGTTGVQLADSRDLAFAVVNRKLHRIDLGTGATSQLHEAAAATEPALTPDARRVAVGVATKPDSYTVDQVLVLDTGSGAVQAVHAVPTFQGAVELAWVDNATLAATGLGPWGTLTFLDAALRPVGTVTGWHTRRLAAAGGSAYGLGTGGRMLQASEQDRAARTIAVPDGATYAIEVVPPPAPPAPTTTTTATTQPPTTITTAAPPPEPTTSVPATVVALPTTPVSSDRPWLPSAAAALLLAGVATTAFRWRKRTT